MDTESAATTGGETGCARFITIPLSHYCEKARWGLDRAALPYREEPHMPLLHRMATAGNGGTSVPILVHGHHRIADSTAILVHADASCGGDLLYPRDAASRREVEALVVRFDTELGPHVRRWAYAYLLPDTKLLRDAWCNGVPRREACLFAVVLPIARRLVRSGYRVNSANGDRSLDRIHDVFRYVDGLVRDERPFLAGDRFSAADLTFAALAAPALFPGGCRAALPALDAVPAAMREEVLRMRETDAGLFAAGLYQHERGVTSTCLT